MRFIDLFAGLGGFHVALKRLGHSCVFACEKEKHLIEAYEKNFGIVPHGDIRKIDFDSIPDHDVLCAGFPCQPFSKAGRQPGTDCPKNGNLFEYVVRILRKKQPKFFIIENVANLQQHASGETWKAILCKLRQAGYAVDAQRLSPHQFGIPQVRDRVYIIGARDGRTTFRWPAPKPDPNMSIKNLLQANPRDARTLSDQVLSCLSVWQKFVQTFPKDEELPSFPIWSMEFGATYPFESQTPKSIGLNRLGSYLGSHGQELSAVNANDRMSALPSYAREEIKFPAWKVQFISQNRAFYLRHRKWIDQWLPNILQFPSSLQKLEWNCKGGVRDIWQYVIQFRASGVRVKRASSSPSLVAMTSTQVPIIAWEKRYMTPRECAGVQGLGELKHLGHTPTSSFKALGNAVNADVVTLVAQYLLTDSDVSHACILPFVRPRLIEQCSPRFSTTLLLARDNNC